MSEKPKSRKRLNWFDPFLVVTAFGFALTVAGHPAMADRAAHQVATVFNWDVIAEQTNLVYKQVYREYVASSW